MLVAVTYPGYVPFNEIRPFVFGLPFSLFWQVLWICGAVLVLSLLYLWERADQPAAGRGREGAESSDEVPGSGASAEGGEG
jgi:hypothetical protein